MRQRNRVILGLGLGAIMGAATLVSAGCQEREVHVGELKPKLVVRSEKVGIGRPVEEGREVDVHYVGRLPSGDIVVSTPPEDPHTFILGDGTVIVGMDMAVRGMRVGGKRVVTVPPDLHYGRAGYAGIIPPNTPMTFEIRLAASR